MNTKSIVNKILEGSDVRSVLSVNEAKRKSEIKIQDFVDTYFDNNVDFYTAGNEFVWYEALIDMNDQIRADFDETFESSGLDWDEWFYTRWGVAVDDTFDDGLTTAPNCRKAGISWEDLADYVRTHNNLDYVTEYNSNLYLVAKQFD